MRDMSNLVGDVDEIRRRRDAENNPPDYEPGQGNDDDWDFFKEDNSSGGFGMNETNDSDFGGSFASGGGSFDSLMNNSTNSNQKTSNSLQKQADDFDKLLDATKSAVKFAGKNGKIVIDGVYDSAKRYNHIFWSRVGNNVIVVSLIVSFVGVALSILGKLTGRLDEAIFIVVGGILSLITGVLVMSMNIDKAREEVKNGETLYGDAEDEQDEEQNTTDAEVDDEGDLYDDYWGDDDEESDDIEEDWGTNDIWNSFEDDVEEVEEEEKGIYQEDINIESAMDSIREIPPHTQTRQYLYEEFKKVLPNITPDFSKLKVISENSDNFIIMDRLLKDAAIQTGMKEDKLPSLLELRENNFIIQLKATRPSGLKEEEIANEIANMYSRDDYGGVLQEGVYATVNSIGSNYIINIFKGESCLVSLADTYRVEEDYILNPQVKKPIIIGVNEIGRVWKFDAENIFSYIFSGKPRSGKSWAVVSLVVQLAMYNSPREVTFEAMDIKGMTSDFYKMNGMIPHFINFEGDRARPEKILSRMRWLIEVEGKRRTEILKKYDVLNIKDLRRKHPDVYMPYHYIIIDEIMGLKGKLDKEGNNEFKDLVNTLITQMPNLGYRLILVPHRVTNEVISKTTYTLVGCVACVKSDFKEIQNTLEVTKREFPYTVSNIGDMALKCTEVNKGSTVFCHGIAVTGDNDTNEDIYRFINCLWRRLEPDIVGTKVEDIPLKSKESYTDPDNFRGDDKGDTSDGLEGVDEIFDDYSVSGDDVDEKFWDELL